MTATDDITGLVLCGGRGLRMGGVDKGLQRFRGLPLALHQLLRLQRQTGACMINANRHLAAYAAFGVPVWPDGLAGHAGPLAGFLAGLEHCRTRWLLTVPCDTPLFPPDLATRLAAAADRQGADIAMAAAPEVDGAGQTRLRPQPVFCLLRVPLQQSLRAFTAAGGRKIGAWAAQQHCASVPFDQPGDDPLAFVNINTWAQLRALDGSTAPAVPAPSPVPSPAPSEDGAAVPGPERV